MTQRVVGLGAGGHARVLIESLRMAGCFELAGLLDPNLEPGTLVLGVPVLGDDSLLEQCVARGIRHFFLGLGSVGDAIPRQRLFERALFWHLEPIQVIHPAACISPSAGLGRGCAVLAGAILSSGAQLGDNVIVNTGAIVDHDCQIGNHVHIATRAALSGNVRLADGVHLGTGAVVRQQVTIGEHAIIGAGAVVIRDIPAFTVAAGIPARVIRRLEQNPAVGA